MRLKPKAVKKTPKPKVRTNIWLHAKEFTALKYLAKKHNLSRSELLGRLITQANI